MFFFSSRRRHTRFDCDWSSDVCSSDLIDYAANAGMVPAVACMGEKDVFFQAHLLMGRAMDKEGLKMINLISPGTGHVIDRSEERRVGEEGRSRWSPDH